MMDETKENLFSYGTLQYEQVQKETFGRLLEGSKDRLMGFSKYMLNIDSAQVVATSGAAKHPIIRPSGNAENYIEGTVFKITPQELIHADKYEVAAYKRVEVVMLSGLRAWAYIDASSTMGNTA